MKLLSSILLILLFHSSALAVEVHQNALLEMWQDAALKARGGSYDDVETWKADGKRDALAEIIVLHGLCQNQDTYKLVLGESVSPRDISCQ